MFQNSFSYPPKYWHSIVFIWLLVFIVLQLCLYTGDWIFNENWTEYLVSWKYFISYFQPKRCEKVSHSNIHAKGVDVLYLKLLLKWLPYFNETLIESVLQMTLGNFYSVYLERFLQFYTAKLKIFAINKQVAGTWLLAELSSQIF